VIPNLYDSQVSLSQTNIYLNSESKNKLMYIKKMDNSRFPKKHVAEKNSFEKYNFLT